MLQWCSLPLLVPCSPTSCKLLCFLLHITFEPWTCSCISIKNDREILASKIWSVYEFHENMERGGEERYCFLLKAAFALLLSVSCHTGKGNYKCTNSRKRLISISLSIRCQNIQELCRKWGLINSPVHRLSCLYKKHWISVICLAALYFYLMCLIVLFSIQKWEDWWLVWHHCFQSCNNSTDICSCMCFAD